MFISQSQDSICTVYYVPLTTQTEPPVVRMQHYMDCIIFFKNALNSKNDINLIQIKHNVSTLQEGQ